MYLLRKVTDFLHFANREDSVGPLRYVGRIGFLERPDVELPEQLEACQDKHGVPLLAWSEAPSASPRNASNALLLRGREFLVKCAETQDSARKQLADLPHARAVARLEVPEG